VVVILKNEFAAKIIFFDRKVTDDQFMTSRKIYCADAPNLNPVKVILRLFLQTLFSN